MLSLFKALAMVGLLGVPVLVILALPRFFEFAGSVPAVTGAPSASRPTPTFRLAEPTRTSGRTRFSAVDDAPPPTLAPPAATPAPMATLRPAPTGERIVIGNTDGVGAVLRAEPVTGSPVGALREQQVLDVLERRNVPPNGDWVRVRTSDGLEGWVTGIVALPLPAANN